MSRVLNGSNQINLEVFSATFVCTNSIDFNKYCIRVLRGGEELVVQDLALGVPAVYAEKTTQNKYLFV